MLVKGTKYRFFFKIIAPSNCSYYEFKTYFTFLNYQNGQMHSTLMHSNDSKCENMNEVNLDVCLESCIHSAPYRLFHLHLFGLCCRWSRSSIEGQACAGWCGCSLESPVTAEECVIILSGNLPPTSRRWVRLMLTCLPDVGWIYGRLSSQLFIF